MMTVTKLSSNLTEQAVTQSCSLKSQIMFAECLMLTTAIRVETFLVNRNFKI